MSYEDPFGSKAAEDFLDGAATAAKWPKVGAVVEGTVIGYSMAQCRDYDENEALFWEGNKKVIESKATDKSKPVMQLLLELQCEPTGETWQGLANTRVELPEDDGMRTAYVKGALRSALIKAQRTAKAKLEVGAYVKMTRTADGPQPDPKYAAPHQYAAQWTPAKQNPKHVAQFMSDDTQAETPFG